jgi:hypothetical protein
VPHERYAAFLKQYTAALQTGHAMYLAETYQQQPYRWAGSAAPLLALHPPAPGPAIGTQHARTRTGSTRSTRPCQWAEAAADAAHGQGAAASRIPASAAASRGPRTPCPPPPAAASSRSWTSPGRCRTSGCAARCTTSSRWSRPRWRRSSRCTTLRPSSPCARSTRCTSASRI